VCFVAVGAPKRTGRCHCLTCRKAHAAAFNPFVVYDRKAVEVSGVTSTWESSPGYEREFFPACGSGVLAGNGAGLELSLGSFDQPGEVTPDDECWTVRREQWLAPLGAVGRILQGHLTPVSSMARSENNRHANWVRGGGAIVRC
jgi:hypothetical protein